MGSPKSPFLKGVLNFKSWELLTHLLYINQQPLLLGLTINSRLDQGDNVKRVTSQISGTSLNFSRAIDIASQVVVSSILEINRAPNTMPTAISGSLLHYYSFRKSFTSMLQWYKCYQVSHHDIIRVF